jgi:hypothetical protein
MLIPSISNNTSKEMRCRREGGREGGWEDREKGRKERREKPF